MSKGRIVILDNASVVGILNNTAALNAFPALKNVAKQLKRKKAGCGRCGGSRAKVIHTVSTNVKAMIGAWPADKKQTLKKILNADTVRVVINKKMTEF